MKPEIKKDCQTITDFFFLTQFLKSMGGKTKK